MFMCDGTIETAKCIWVNTWSMLDWFGHKTAEIHSFSIQMVN